MEEEKYPDSLQVQLHSLLVPKEILIYFELTSIVDQSANITINLTEKPDLIPEKLKW